MNKSSRTKNSTLNFITGTVGQILVILLRFVTRTVLIYTLGKAYLGINGLFSDVLSMLSLTELGLDTAINFKFYKPLAEHDDQRVRVLVKFYKQAYRVIGAVVLALGLCLIPFLPTLIKDYDSLSTLGINAPLIFILYLLQSVSSYLFFAYRSAVMRADQKKHILDVADYVVTIAQNTAQILVLVFLQDFLIYTGIGLVFVILKNFVNAKIAERYYPQFFIKEEKSLQKEEVIGLFKDCGALFVYKVNNVVLKATDNIVLSSFLGLSIVGLYSNYLLFCIAIKTLLGQIYAAVRASMGNLFVVSNIETKYRFFQIMNYLTILTYGTAAVGLAVCSDELIRVWITYDYVIPQPFSILIGVEILFTGLTINLGQIRNVSGIFRQLWYRPVIGVIINIVVSVILVQICGIYGVIIGTIVSILFANFLVDPSVIHKYAFEHYKPVSEYYRKNLLYIAILVLVAAADMWLCSVVFVGHGWFSAVAHIIIVSLSVPSVFTLLYWKSHECQYLVQLVKRVLKQVTRKVFG